MSVYVGFKIGKASERKAYISEYYCGGCGYPVSDHDRYCPECGGAFRKEDATERTCELEQPKSGVRRCKRCGAFVSSNAVFDCFGVIPTRYCPNCGGKVTENGRA